MRTLDYKCLLPVQITTLNNFVLDPQHIPTSSTTTPAVNDQLPIPALPLPNLPLPLPNLPHSMTGTNASAQQMQMMMMMQMQQAMLMNMGQQGMAAPGGTGGLGGRIGGYADHDAPERSGGGGEDPRAKKGRVSYRDLDEGGGGLPY